MRSKRFFEIWERRGYHVTPVHFYEPIPDTRTLDLDSDRISELPGVDMDESGQLALLQEIRQWESEYLQPTWGNFTVRNRYFGAVDAEVYWGIIRARKPKRIYEIGGGHSTLLAAEAVQVNQREGASCELVTFEPFPNETLRQGFPGLARLEQYPVQEIPLARFAELEAGDILFVDSSHVAAAGSDVCLEILEIFPRLKSGVHVHVHDIFLPGDYPRHFLVNLHYFWTEQYLLHAFLAFNSAYRVLWGSAYMGRRHPKLLAEAFTSFTPGRQPGSFWIVRN
jgi:hypothetical protein